jgi:transposase
MNASLFWFTDEQWAKIKPHLPTNQPGPERGDDRRILSGIMHVQRSGCRWKDCPSEYGPHKTIYNRFARWSARGIWQNLLAAVAGDRDVRARIIRLTRLGIRVFRLGGIFRQLQYYILREIRQLLSTSEDKKSRKSISEVQVLACWLIQIGQEFRYAGRVLPWWCRCGHRLALAWLRGQPVLLRSLGELVKWTPSLGPPGPIS